MYSADTLQYNLLNTSKFVPIFERLSSLQLSESMTDLSLYNDTASFNKAYDDLGSENLTYGMHINCRSLSVSKCDNLCMLIDSICIKPTFIALIETWLTSDKFNMVNIEGF